MTTKREAVDYSAEGAPVAYSPIISVDGDDLLKRLRKEHGSDPRRTEDDLTDTLDGRSTNGRGLALRARFWGAG